MAAKLLGQFLLERGVISAAQLLAAIEAQRATNPLLGELALREDFSEGRSIAALVAAREYLRRETNG